MYNNKKDAQIQKIKSELKIVNDRSGKRKAKEGEKENVDPIQVWNRRRKNVRQYSRV